MAFTIQYSASKKGLKAAAKEAIDLHKSNKVVTKEATVLADVVEELVKTKEIGDTQVVSVNMVGGDAPNGQKAYTLNITVDAGTVMAPEEVTATDEDVTKPKTKKAIAEKQKRNKAA